MMKKMIALLSLATVLGTLGLSSAYALDSSSSAIAALQEKGIVSGTEVSQFGAQSELTYAQALQLIVNAFDYNLDAIRFKTQPKAADIYPKVKSDAWYSNAFVVTYYNDLKLDKNVNLNASISREQFADLLENAMEKKDSSYAQAGSDQLQG